MNQGPKSVFSTSTRLKKCVFTAALFYSTFTLGMCSTFLNSAILTFSRRLNTNIEHVSKVFIVILVSYICSALSCGVIFRFVSRQKCVVLLLSLMSLALFSIPHATTLTTLFLASSLIGLGGGGYDTAQMAWIIDIWRNESPPFILSQNFVYSLGTLIPPILLAPYLRTGPEASIDGEMLQTSLDVPFTIAGCLVVLAVVIHLTLIWVCKGSKPSEVDNNNDILRALLAEETPEEAQFTVRKIYFVVLACCITGFYCGLEQITSQFLPTFSHFSPVALTEAEGARVLFGLQVGFSVGRLLGIGLVLKVPPSFLLTGNLALLFIANMILMNFAGTSIAWLWAGSILFGLGMSTVYPSTYAYVSKHVFVTDGVAAIISVSGGIVSSIYPVIVGRSVETNPAIVTYVNFVSITVCTLAFATLVWTTRRERLSNYIRL
ncbi:unnamed protein product [Allacma fusca]|uniref:Sodium-dependent glucose transporter 1 n=1 Tax=Allacma fusca TaxID=39272 RepID=A0A8J2KKA8_9HEXA|nr:unnamed protein product [Allacma fusca]